MRHTSRDRRNRIRHQKIAKKLHREAKLRKKASKASKKAG
jgi:hypothetical protein